MNLPLLSECVTLQVSVTVWHFSRLSPSCPNTSVDVGPWSLPWPRQENHLPYLLLHQVRTVMLNYFTNGMSLHLNTSDMTTIWIELLVIHYYIWLLLWLLLLVLFIYTTIPGCNFDISALISYKSKFYYLLQFLQHLQHLKHILDGDTQWWCLECYRVPSLSVDFCFAPS